MEQIFQVPNGFSAKGMPGPPPIAIPVRAAPKPRPPAGLHPILVQPTPRQQPGYGPQKISRPSQLTPEPTPDFPSPTGEFPPDVMDPFEAAGLIENKPLGDQVLRRMTDEAKRINHEVAKAVEKKGGQALTPEQRGTAIRKAFGRSQKPPPAGPADATKARGKDDQAAEIAKDFFTLEDRPQMVDGDLVIAQGRWGDLMCGRTDENILVDVVLDALEEGRETTLNLLWEANPDHVGFAAAVEKGMFR